MDYFLNNLEEMDETPDQEVENLFDKPINQEDKIEEKIELSKTLFIEYLIAQYD